MGSNIRFNLANILLRVWNFIRISFVCFSGSSCILVTFFAFFVCFCVCLRENRVSLCHEFCVTICGGRWFVLFMGGNFVFTLVCDFDINLCEKNGGDYVMVIFTLMVLIMGSICVLHHNFHRREIFVCLNLIGWCVCLV